MWFRNLIKERKKKGREEHLKTIEIACIKADSHLSEHNSGQDLEEGKGNKK